MTTTALMNTYGTRKLTLTKGEGAYVWDDQGNKYLDALSGIAVCVLGHAHPKVTQAISDQAATLLHCSNLYNIGVQEQLADKLRELSGMTNVFFGNSGAEANEAAIKLARLHGHAKGIETPTVIVTENSFHGRTLATLSATGNRKVHAGFEPLVRGFARAPYNNVETIETIINNNPSIAAVMVEPIQGEGGVRVPDDDYLQRLRKLCDEKELLLILDEIQTGNGRTGSFFHYQQKGIVPDVVTLAKGLGNGVPIGACLASGQAATLMQPGNHGSTFGGNPLSCAAALATVNALIDEKLLDNAATMGNYLLQQFAQQLADTDAVTDIRGNGLMMGIELTTDCADIVDSAVEAGLLLNVTAGNVIRLLPPLNLNKDQADQIINTIVSIIKARK